ncbi:MAG: DNA alkylation repair protein [Chloroflexi bacterium]|nr:DNA alkylation repair protein [Chloroflexota bacterium]
MTAEQIDSTTIAEEIEVRLQALPSQRTADVRTVRREFSKRLVKAPAQTILNLARQLLPRHRFVAYELVCHHRAAMASLGEAELEQLGRGMASWGDVDTFACYLSGPAWREQQVRDALIHRWAHSPDRWWRRAAVVSTVPLNNKTRGGHGDTTRTLAICRLLVGDQDDMVVKALSWALRELAKRDPQAVREFLAEHEQDLVARVKREVQHKLTTGLKNPRRK